MALITLAACVSFAAAAFVVHSSGQQYERTDKRGGQENATRWRQGDSDRALTAEGTLVDGWVGTGFRQMKWRLIELPHLKNTAKFPLPWHGHAVEMVVVCTQQVNIDLIILLIMGGKISYQ